MSPPDERLDRFPPGADDGRHELLAKPSYARLRRSVVLATATVSLAPLVILTAINLSQYETVFRRQARQPVSRLTLNLKRSLELFLAERRSALEFVSRDKSFAELCSHQELARVVVNLNRSQAVGALVDLGIIDSEGNQLYYSGPYQLEGRDYSDQQWFDDVVRRGSSTSDVFLGYRNVPHFALASRHDEDGGFYVVRATIDAGMLSAQLAGSTLSPADDVFLINREGVLQTASRRYGELLGVVPFPPPAYSPVVEVSEREDEHGALTLFGYAFVEGSPFVVVYIGQWHELMGRWWALRSELIAFLAASAVLILGVILWGSNQFVTRMRESAQRRAALYHEVEYTNKLASIGRLAAGVAHEINNPLAIINEKAGLLKDLVTISDASPPRERVAALLDSVLASVERCRSITHRLLGFAKHMDVGSETIDLHVLLKEVLGFLGKEAEYRNLSVSFEVADDLPTIESDRSQLQQVFLNILNNAFAAVDDGGSIAIALAPAGGETVAATIADRGAGIPKEHLKRIFEPFFTTKEGSGTGLGLSITYGIVKKLGGEIAVESEVGRGTAFTVVLPLRRKV